MVRRKVTAPRSKSFDKKSDAEKWARDLEAQVDAAGYVPDTKIAEQTTFGLAVLLCDGFGTRPPHQRTWRDSNS